MDFLIYLNEFFRQAAIRGSMTAGEKQRSMI